MATLNEIGKKSAWLLLAVIFAGLIYAATAGARTPTLEEWHRAAERQASRECLQREERSPVIGEFPFQIPIHVCNRYSAKSQGPCLRALENDRANCPAEFTMDYWTTGFHRHFSANVPMYLARPRPRDADGHRIGVMTPIDWVSWKGRRS